MRHTAPIALFVYNRLQHTQQVVTALQANELASQSNLYIYADAPKHAEAAPQVEQVRSYLSSITGFKSVHIRLREKNLGVDENIMQGVSEIIHEHGRAIVLEDDLVTSPWFLKFMNEALDCYEHNEEVASIHGYLLPLQQKIEQAFFLKGADCWGWATWQRAWDLFERDGSKLLDELEKRDLQKEFDFNNAYPYFDTLKQQAIGNTKEWDIRWYASMFLAGKLTLYPSMSLVKNIGHDATGVHCSNSNIFDVQLSPSPVPVQVPVVHSKKAFLAFSAFMKYLSSIIFPQKSWLSRSFRKVKNLGEKLRAR